MFKRTGKNKGHTYIIAEISANHCQNFRRAVNLIKKAKACGVDAVKFQTYTPDSLTIDHDNKYFKIRHPKWGGQTLYELYKKAYTPWKWFGRLKKAADHLGIDFFSTAFDKQAVDLLEGLNVGMHKIASFELVDLDLIEYAAGTGKPIIMSTGMASIAEIKDAMDTARKAGAKDITLLKCVSSYPTEPEDMNLATIPDMKKRFNCSVGLSDHTLGIGVAVAAVTLGATVVEKHFTDCQSSSSPDSFFSLTPSDMRSMVDSIRTAEKSIGNVYYGISKKEKTSRVFRRSLFAVRDIKKGERFTENNIRSIRPAYGLSPKHIKKVLGKKAARNIPKGSPLKKYMIAK